MKRLFLTGVAALSVLSTSAAHAAEIKVVRLFTTPTYVTLGGPIQATDYAEFNKLTQAIKGDVVVWLSSPGGDARAAIKIGNFIHMNQWTTSVGFGNQCNSACAIIWLSGVHRRLSTDARIGVHSMGMPDGSGKRNDFGNAIVFGYLRAIGVSEEIIERFYKTDPCCLDFIDYEQALRLELLSDPPAPSKKGNQWWNPQAYTVGRPDAPAHEDKPWKGRMTKPAPSLANVIATALADVYPEHADTMTVVSALVAVALEVAHFGMRAPDGQQLTSSELTSMFCGLVKEMAPLVKIDP
jgi:hypothetical protein